MVLKVGEVYKVIKFSKVLDLNCVPFNTVYTQVVLVVMSISRTGRILSSFFVFFFVFLIRWFSHLIVTFVAANFSFIFTSNINVSVMSIEQSLDPQREADSCSKSSLSKNS